MSIDWLLICWFHTATNLSSAQLFFFFRFSSFASARERKEFFFRAFSFFDFSFHYVLLIEPFAFCKYIKVRDFMTWRCALNFNRSNLMSSLRTTFCLMYCEKRETIVKFEWRFPDVALSLFEFDGMREPDKSKASCKNIWYVLSRCTWLRFNYTRRLFLNLFIGCAVRSELTGFIYK